MPHQPPARFDTAVDSTPASNWPPTSGRDVTVVCSVELELQERTVSIVRVLGCGTDVVVRTAVWNRTYGSSTDADDAFAALNSAEGNFLHWSVGATAFGSTWLNATIENVVDEFVATRDEELARLARELERERARLEEERDAETRIEAIFRKRLGRYVLNLERGNEEVVIWSIAFDEAWERDRFWDWFGWQTDRFEALAQDMQEGCRLDLERSLLREMLVTEQAVKKQGLGSGGRRPLRFWRGEL